MKNQQRPGSRVGVNLNIKSKPRFCRALAYLVRLLVEAGAMLHPSI